MRNPLKQPIAAFFDPMVVVTMMTTGGLIIGILALAYAALVPVGWKIFTLCSVVGLVGILTMLLQIRAILSRP